MHLFRGYYSDKGSIVQLMVRFAIYNLYVLSERFFGLLKFGSSQVKCQTPKIVILNT